MELPLEAGLRFEAECFAELFKTPEAKALQYSFFSDRRAAVVDDLPPGQGARLEVTDVTGFPIPGINL